VTRAPASCSTLETLASAASVEEIARATCDLVAAVSGVCGLAFVDWPENSARCLATGGIKSAIADQCYAWLATLWAEASPALPVVQPQGIAVAIPIGRTSPIAALLVHLYDAESLGESVPALCRAADLAYVALRWRQRLADLEAGVADSQGTLAASEREQFRRTERLASIGVLAAGIAHELNNPLGAIMLEAETALMTAKRAEPQPLLLSSLEGIRQNVERCAQIVQGVLRFAKRQPEEYGPCDLVSVLQSARDYSRELAVQRSVRVCFGDTPRGAGVLGSRLALEQVFVNLFHNAIQASCPGDTVEVGVRVGPTEVSVAVADHGDGIAPADLPRVFSPFFTTRLPAAGTGLGLSIVQGIVADHRGRVEVCSQVGQGAIFTVVLPRMLEP
jgi:signal transduction histidine kinase